MLKMAEAGLGVACLPDLLIHDQLADGTLVTVLDDYVDHEGTLRLLWPSSRHLSSKLRVFIDFMSANFMPQRSGAKGRRFNFAPSVLVAMIGA